MSYSRAYRKFVSQLWAYVVFRWMAIWLLVAACSARGQAGEAAAFVIIAGNIGLGLVLKAQVGTIEDKYAKDWHDRLANRIFYRLFWEQIVAGGAKSIVVDELMRDATTEARADIQKASDDEKATWGALDKTGWHWFGGVISFFWQWVTALLYYGSAWIIGHGS